jgi:hypothetical protein
MLVFLNKYYHQSIRKCCLHYPDNFKLDFFQEAFFILMQYVNYYYEFTHYLEYTATILLNYQ